MIRAGLHSDERIHDLMESLRPFFDVVRLVDPARCCVLNADPAQDGDQPCYAVWEKGDRCRNCTSYRAAASGALQEKNEDLDGDSYHVISVPISFREEGKDNVFVLELVQKDAGGPEGKYRKPQQTPLRSVGDENFFTRELMHKAAGLLASGIILLDEGGMPIYANGAAFRMLRVSPNLKVLGDVLAGWLEINYQARIGGTWNQFYLAEGRELLYEIQYLHITTDYGTGRFLVLHDVTKLTGNLTGEDYRRTHDALTGLFNREGFNQAARRTIRDNPETPFSLIRMDMRDFRLVNQLYGIVRGNEILMKAAGFIRNLAGPGDVYGRLYGDQFVILTRQEGFDRERLLSYAKAFAQEVDTGVWQTRVHFGIYNITDRTERIEYMCDKAQMAIRTIEDEAEVSIASYDESMLREALFESEILSSFDQAMENGQLRIYLQPQCSKDGKILSCEALVRWYLPGRGIVPPSRFIGVLERAGLIYRLDRHIWNQAAKILCSWKGTPLEGIRVSVNISPRDLPYIDVEEYFIELTNMYGIDRKNLGIELTEDAAIQNPGKCAEMVESLKKLGFMVELDDFGSGYSSLNLLKDISVSGIKLDMGFLQRPGDPERTRIILAHMIAMTNDLHMDVIIEGVESGEQVEMLSRLGCGRFQGYFFSEPVPVKTFEELVRKQEERT